MRNLGPEAEIPDGWEGRLRRWELQAAARELLPENRIQGCYRHRMPGQGGAEGIRVYRRRETSTYYRGLKVCGQVWCCPVCAAKISERRRGELAGAVGVWRAQGGHVALLTLTVPHNKKCGKKGFELLAGLLEAFRKLGQGKRAWTKLTPGYAGFVRALEVTHGEHGWHPHLHVLVFLEGKTDLEALGVKLFARWAACVANQGLGEVKPGAFHLEDERAASRYLVKYGAAGEVIEERKWGGAEELTKAHIKTGRRGGRTPWALLADYSKGDQQAGALFVEFVQTFKGRSQLQWSRGLRDLLGLNDEKTDEQLALETTRKDDLLVALIEPYDWRVIRRHSLQGQVLELLRASDWSAVVHLLDFHREREAVPLPQAAD